MQTLDENLGLVEVEGKASVLLEYMLDVRTPALLYRLQLK